MQHTDTQSRQNAKKKGLNKFLSPSKMLQCIISPKLVRKDNRKGQAQLKNIIGKIYFFREYFLTYL
jgi:hypothetical protein